MAEPTEKKMKTDHYKGTLSKFISDDKKVKVLKDAASAIRGGFNEMQLFVLEVEETNARAAKSFSNATCTTKMHKSSEGNELIRIEAASIFKEGLYTLDKFLDKDNPKIPAEIKIQSALAKLVLFLDEKHDRLLSTEPIVWETFLAIDYAEQLLQRLTGGTFLIDGRSQGQYGGPDLGGDTSFGCQNGWHGFSDILLGETKVQNAKGQYELTSVSSSTEVKKTKFTSSDKEQLKAQTIVFSFLQHKLKGSQNNCMIPGIGLSPGELYVYFYDCVEDVFLTSDKLSFSFLYKAWDEDRDSVVVVFLWLVLNYDIFCTGAPERVKQKYKARFHDIVGDRIDMYLKDVKFGLGFGFGKAKEDKEDLELMKKSTLHVQNKEYDEYKSVNKFVSLYEDNCPSSS